MDEHTPGPWHTHDAGKGITQITNSSEANYSVIAVVYSDMLQPHISAANAKLMAAAPELLSALEKLLEATEWVGHGETLDATEARARDALRLARDGPVHA